MLRVSLKQMELLCFRILMLNAFLNILLPGLQMNRVVSLLIIGNIAVSLVMLILRFLNDRTINAGILIAYLLAVGFSFFSVIISMKTLSFGYMRKWIMYVTTLSYFLWAVDAQCTSKMLGTIKRGAIAYSGAFLFLYFSGRTYMLGSLGITFNLGNPNFTGMWVLAVALLLIALIPRFETRRARAALVLVIVFLVYCIFLTGARSCLIALLAGLFLMIVGKIYHLRLWGRLGVWVPLCFPFFYLYIINSDWFRSIFAFAVSEGKGVDSRVAIWERALEIFREAPALGNYYLATNGAGVGQLHNVYMDALAAYGLLGTFSLCVFMLILIRQIYRSAKVKTSKTPIYLFVAFLISGTFEASLFAGSQSLFVLVGALILLSKPVACD